MKMVRCCYYAESLNWSWSKKNGFTWSNNWNLSSRFGRNCRNGWVCSRHWAGKRLNSKLGKLK